MNKSQLENAEQRLQEGLTLAEKARRDAQMVLLGTESSLTDIDANAVISEEDALSKLLAPFRVLIPAILHIQKCWTPETVEWVHQAKFRVNNLETVPIGAESFLSYHAAALHVLQRLAGFESTTSYEKAATLLVDLGFPFEKLLHGVHEEYAIVQGELRAAAPGETVEPESVPEYQWVPI